ncbi:hypothetical protein BDN72DRAFT_861107 [Pluteus cervinus]|uniref:Uncharacterized protein n=1 Tax=Pluteus cervinus TaxID=181527 RepID=A0ACD3AGE3_9AGAR|nr:hypothetical protein BDN72DRAFT_861107 [Pluteus cervinus]
MQRKGFVLVWGPAVYIFRPHGWVENQVWTSLSVRSIRSYAVQRREGLVVWEKWEERMRRQAGQYSGGWLIVSPRTSSGRRWMGLSELMRSDDMREVGVEAETEGCVGSGATPVSYIFDMQHLVRDSSSSRQVAFKKIDDEIEILMHQVRQFKSQRNGHSIASTLPVEVISEIFMITQVQTYDPDDPVSTLKLWLSITHVSRHWRAVALECSQLWTPIYSLPEAGIQEFLSRSKKAALFVDIWRSPVSQDQDGGDYSDVLLATVFSQCSRIRELRLRGWGNSVMEYLTCGSAPVLEVLSIDGSYGPDDVVDIGVDVDIFHGTTPRLNTLSLDNCRVIPQCCLFADSLTTLDMKDCPMGSTVIWLTIIRGLSRLANLSLLHCFTDRSGVDFPPIPFDFEVVSLNYLSTLAIAGWCFKTDLDFLAHITFPSHTEVEFASGTGRFLSLPRSTSAPLIDFLRVQQRSRQGRPQMQRPTIRLTDGLPADDVGINFSLCDEVDYIRFNTHGLLLVDCDAILWTELKSLVDSSDSITLYISCMMTSEAFRSLSYELPNVRVVWCSNGAVAPFLSVLGSVSGEYVAPVARDLLGSQNTWVEAVPDGSQPLSFSLLRSVGLYHVSVFGQPVKTVRFFEVEDVEEEFLDMVQELVRDLRYEPGVWWGDTME